MLLLQVKLSLLYYYYGFYSFDKLYDLVVQWGVLECEAAAF